MKLLANLIFLTFIFLTHIAFIPLYSIDDAFKAGKENKTSEDLIHEEKLLDSKIRELSDQLQKMYALRDISAKVILTPNRTFFNTGKNEDGAYIELTAYTSVAGVHNHGRPIGTDSKTMRLYFSGKDLSKIETIVDDRNFQIQSRHFTKTTHPSPVKGSPDEIVAIRSLNKPDEASEKKPDYQQILKHFENDSSNPTRIQFKRDFYIPNLIIFESLFRQTFELQKRNATSKDMVTIQRMRNSLR